MKITAAILASLTLGLTVPAAAHAQLIDNPVLKVAAPAEPKQGQGRGQPNQKERGPNERPPEAPPVRLISLDQAISAVRRATPGRFLDADAPDAGSSRPVFIIRWQADSGQRIDFTVDARTGAIIGRRG